TTQRLLNRGSRLTELLKQAQFSPLKTEEQVAVIFAGVNGYLDKLPVGDIGKFEEAFLRHMRSTGSNILDAIRNEKALSDDTEKRLTEALDSFSANFAASSGGTEATS
ncbi:MAG: F0F1 ATP synthase subunit alpha, partial [Pseudomonadota bacterium]